VIIVKINGQDESFEIEKINLLDYLREKNIQPEMVAVEMNMNIISKQKYGETYLSNGDAIEIVKFVGGG